MIIDDIALTFEAGVNCTTAAHLLDVFGSAEAIYQASEQDLLQKAELRADIARSILKKQSHRRAAQQLEFMKRNGITGVESTSPLYPALLRECNDFPHVIYLKGDALVLSAPMLSMVGTRKPNSYGLSACNKLVEGLARLMPDLVIVSGLAYGVDVACHRAALAHGLRTIGVLANQVTDVYPSVHRGVAEEMARTGGAVISELAADEGVNKARFLQRNRIIAGMSAGTVVMQSPASGGSMITAGLADGYNRCVMAPPANIGEETSAGTNALIRNMKARMICSAEDILAELGWTSTVDERRDLQPALPQDQTERRVYDYICSAGRVSVEQIETTTGIGLQQLLGVLLELEFGGFVRPLPGNKFEKF